jgi:cytidylate kinase
MHFITFTRELGSNGGEVAKKVADRLGYRLIDTATIEEKAQEIGLLESVAEIDEKAPSFFKRIFSQQPNINLARLYSIIYEFGRQGDTVFLGRGGHMLLRNFRCALHIHVTASFETRIRNLVERGYEKKSVQRAIEMSDRDRSGFMRFAFGVSWSNSRIYDLVMNMDKLGIDSAVEVVISAAQSGGIKDCSKESLEVLGRYALISKAETAIVTSGISNGFNAIVSVSIEESGKLQLSGIVYDKESKDRAEEVVKKIEGIEGIVNQIQVLPPERHT